MQPPQSRISTATISRWMGCDAVLGGLCVFSIITDGTSTVWTEGQEVKRKKSDQAQYVGIFWLVNGKLVIDSTPLNKAEPYGDHRDHPRSHIDVWEQFQRLGKAPRESEYEEFPRGRVIYDSASGTFTLFADRCILERKDRIKKGVSGVPTPFHNFRFARYSSGISKTETRFRTFGKSPFFVKLAALCNKLLRNDIDCLYIVLRAAIF